MPSSSRVKHAKMQWEQLTNDTASYPTRLESSSTLQWETLLQSIDSIFILWYDAISRTWHKYHSSNLFPKILHVHLGKLLQILIFYVLKYEMCLESKDTKVLKTCTIFLIYKSDTVNELPVHNFIFQHSHWHCPNIY